MKATNLSNNDQEAILQDHHDSNHYPNEYECAEKSKRRTKKRGNNRSPKSEKWIKTRSRSDIPLGRYRGISGSSAMDEEAIEYDLRQDEHYFFDNNDMFSEEECQSLQYRGVLKSEGNAPMKLYVDGLNYLDRFFTINRSKRATVMIDFEKDLKKAQSKVKNFVKSAKNSNINLDVFIDKSVATEETFLKWKSRREQEFEDGRDSVPPCPSILLGELFKANGIEVHYSTVDCDDTIASFAYHYGGNVLSNDSDFFRYTARKKKSSTSSLWSGKQRYFQIFSNFQLQDGELLLIPKRLRPNKIIASDRIFLSPPPETRTTAYFFDQPMQWEVDEHPEIYRSLPHMYTRGNVSHLLRHFTNLHLTVRPMRQAVYNRLGEKRVRERICTWNFDEGKVVWVEEDVFPDDTLDYLLDNPQVAVKFFFHREMKPKNVSDLSWKNHLFAQKVVVASICAWATGKPILNQLPKTITKVHQELEKMTKTTITKAHQELENMPKTTKVHQRLENMHESTNVQKLEKMQKSRKEEFENMHKSTRVHQELNMPETTKAHQRLEKMHESTKVNQKLVKINESTKVNQKLEKMNESTKVNQKLEKMNKSTKVNQKLEKMNESTKVNQELEKIPKSTKVHKKLENMHTSTKVNQELEKIPKSTNVHKKLENLRESTKVHKKLENIPKTTKGYQEFENLHKSTKVHQELNMPETTGKIPSKLKELGRISDPNIKPDVPERYLYCAVCEMVCRCRHAKNQDHQELEKMPKATCKIPSKLGRISDPNIKPDVPERYLYCAVCKMVCRCRHAKNQDHQELEKMPKATCKIPSKQNELDRISAVLPTYCSACDEQFINASMYQSHIGGRRHAKKAAVQINNDFPKVKDAPSFDLYCATCDLQCNNAAMYQSHVGGKPHAKKANIKNAPQGVAPSFDLYCATCDLQCNNAAMYQSHVGGKPHAKKANIKNAPSFNLYCVMCDAQCNNAIMYQSHIGGRRHAKKAAAQINNDFPKVRDAPSFDLYCAMRLEGFC